MAGWFPLFTSPIATGWNTLPLGCGGLPTGINIANDGSMVCRTDVGNIYRWSGKTSDCEDPSKRWIPLLTYAGLGSSASMRTSCGGWEHVLAPNDSSIHLAIFGDIAGNQNKSWVYYGTWDGTKVAWNQTNLAFSDGSTDGNFFTYKSANYKLAIDPVNAAVAYSGGGTLTSGNSAGAYTTLNQAGGSTLATWTSVKTSGATPIPAITTGAASGIAFDPSQGTTTVGGQTVTKRILIPVGGQGIFESTDGGVTFSEVAVSQIGSSNFYVSKGGFNSAGDYFCIVNASSSAVYGVWRYSGGTWANITPNPGFSGGASAWVPQSASLIIDPANPNYLTALGPSGVGYGFTTSTARTATSASWTGSTSSSAGNVTSKAASYDLGYINYIFGQGHTFSLIVSCQVCPVTGIFFKTGNQSIYYAVGSAGSTTGIGPPTFPLLDTYMQSIGRGMEATVAQDVLCPPGGTYPVLATQDLGTPMRGTFTTYPNDMVIRYLEYTCENLEYAASDPSFVVARATGQGGSFADVSSYSPNYGADGTWAQIADTPTALWQGAITATISNGAGGAGTILDVSACTGQIFPNAQITQNADASGTYYGKVQPYGTGGTTGTGGVGTYTLDTTSTRLTPISLYSVILIQGGQTVAVDHDHWVTVPAGLNVNPIPAYTTNATGAASWALCSGLPAVNWMGRPWTFGFTPKPFAVGYGSDLGLVWALQLERNAGTTKLYRSDDSGANFHQIDSWSISNSVSASGGPLCLSVPGFPGEIWATGIFTGGSPTGLWHLANANTDTPTRVSINLPADANLVKGIAFGAPATPGAYPTLYLLGWSGNVAPTYLYRGTYPGSGSTVTWMRHGPTGTQNDLPASLQINGIAAIRGDWGVFGRIYAASGGAGLAYYNP